MLSNLKILLGITDTSKDDLLNLIISRCTAEFEAFTHVSYSEAADSVILSMCVYNYNQLGTEGSEMERYAESTYRYTQTYPETILSSLRSMRKIRVIG